MIANFIPKILAIKVKPWRWLTTDSLPDINYYYDKTEKGTKWKLKQQKFRAKIPYGNSNTNKNNEVPDNYRRVKHILCCFYGLLVFLPARFAFLIDGGAFTDLRMFSPH